jgi:hypothetical protein
MEKATFRILASLASLAKKTGLTKAIDMDLSISQE